MCETIWDCIRNELNPLFDRLLNSSSDIDFDQSMFIKKIECLGLGIGPCILDFG